MNSELDRQVEYTGKVLGWNDEARAELEVLRERLAETEARAARAEADSDRLFAWAKKAKHDDRCPLSHHSPAECRCTKNRDMEAHRAAVGARP